MFMDFPTLKLPPEDFSIWDSLMAEDRPGTFAHKYHSLLQEYDDRTLGIKAKKDASEMAQASAVCDVANHHYDWMRRELDKQMQAFLLKRGGVIDSWPSPSSHEVRTSDWVQHDRLVFNYFGANYTFTEDGHAQRTDSQPVYRNTYEYTEKHPFQEMLRKEEDLKRTAATGRSSRKPLGRLGFLLAFLYCVFAALCILGEIIFGTGDALVAQVRTLGPNEGALGFFAGALRFVVLLPVRLYIGLQDFFRDFPIAIISIVIAVVFVGACLFGAYLFLSCLRMRENDIKKGKAAAKEAQALAHSPEYLQARQDEEDEKLLHQLNDKLAEQWHRAWFEWVRKNFYEEGAEEN